MWERLGVVRLAGGRAPRGVRVVVAQAVAKAASKAAAAKEAG